MAHKLVLSLSCSNAESNTNWINEKTRAQQQQKRIQKHNVASSSWTRKRRRSIITRTKIRKQIMEENSLLMDMERQCQIEQNRIEKTTPFRSIMGRTCTQCKNSSTTKQSCPVEQMDKKTKANNKHTNAKAT